MTKTLDVYLHEHLVGCLIQESSGQLQFSYDSDWLRDPHARALSQSLPLVGEPFGHRACRPFFAGLLPEAELRDRIARVLGITARNDFALLDRIGGECAGAVTLVRPGERPPARPTNEDYEALSEAELAAILRILPERPLLAGRQGIRLSLAGAQDKLPVRLLDDSIALPLHGAASSHILKPEIRRYPETVENEAFCLSLARDLELHVVDVEIRRAEGRPYLLVSRYDRVRTGDGSLLRLHQEDFCQALGIAPERKYQSEGGPSLTQCFDLVRRSCSRPVIDLARLLDFVIFNALIGNHDAHGKNFSLLDTGGGLEQAPLYDVVSTRVYPDLSPRLAMRIGDRDRLEEVMPRHWERFAKEAGLASPLVRRRVLDLAKRAPEAARRVADAMTRQGHFSTIVTRILSIIDDQTARVRRSFHRDST